MIRAVAIAAALALIAGTVAVLALAAAADAWLHDGTTVLVALTAVWVAQGVPTVIRTWRHQ